MAAGSELESRVPLFSGMNNGELSLAFTGRYGRDRNGGAYTDSAVNDGPFFCLLVIDAAGPSDIPFTLLLAAIIPLLLGVIIGNLDSKWAVVMRPIPNMVIPFFAFALGVNLGNIVTGGLSGIVVGRAATLITDTLACLGYRFLLRRGKESGIRIGSAITTPASVGAADPSYAPFVQVATAQVASAVLVSAVLTPMIAFWMITFWMITRQGGLKAAADSPDPAGMVAAGMGDSTDPKAREATKAEARATGKTGTGCSAK